jgi:hypothetical protein
MSNSELFKQTRLAPILLSPITNFTAPHTFAALSLTGGAPPSGSPPPAGGTLSSGGGPAVYQLSFTIQPQAEDQWCWAAVSVSVCSFYSSTTSWTQCSLVSAELGDPSCCADGSTPGCNRAWTLNTALNRTNNLLNWAVGTVNSAGIQAELAASHPLCCRIGWSNGGGHFVAMSGYQNDGVVEEVTIDDPFFGRSHVVLTVFATSYQNDGTWTHSYYTKP